MKKKLHLFLCFNIFLLINSLHAATIQNPVIIEITDETLNNVYYHQINFTVPTKLVFTNLTQVNGYIYFHQNTNLVAIDFPKLTQTKGYVYIYGNKNLVTLNMLQLTTIGDYLAVDYNSSLSTFNICGLKNIKKTYSITNNTANVDAFPFCFYKEPPTNLLLSNNAIDENSPLSTLIGTISANSNDPNQILTYSLKNSANGSFKIIGNQLFTNTPLDYETKNQYKITIAVRNQIGESINKDFIISINDLKVENFTTIEITDTTLDNVFYHQTNFTGPTKLVFTNLTAVKGYVYFHQNTNLISVEFPVLTQTGDYFYVHENQSLESIKAPQLTTIKDYLHVNGNKNLTALEICGLKEIKSPRNPSYYIYNNTPAVDALPFCFYKEPPTNLLLSNNVIDENLSPDTFIGNISADSNDPNAVLTYSLKNNSENRFKIIENKLYTNRSFDYEAKNQYKITIAVRNQTGENISKDFMIDIIDVEVENINIIEITDTTLENVNYHQNNFTGPTKLVFTNLTTVKEFIFFNQNSNLIGIEFPKLIQTGSYFYISGNQSLESVKAVNLNTLKDYLYVEGNQKLTELRICGLKDIQSTNITSTSYYYIKNNLQLDMNTTCLTNTIVTFTPVDPILVLPAPNTLIGTFTSDVIGDSIHYFFVDEKGDQTINPNFTIINDKLYLTNEYNTYDEKDFVINIAGIRTASNSVTNKVNTTKNLKLNEKLQLSISFNIANASLGVKPTAISDKKIIIFPNPAKNNFEIESPEKITDVKLFDMTGRQLKNLKNSNSSIDVSNVTNGNYMVLIKTENNVLSTHKLIIIK